MDSFFVFDAVEHGESQQGNLGKVQRHVHHSYANLMRYQEIGGRMIRTLAD
jgi:hypothetical protein